MTHNDEIRILSSFLYVRSLVPEDMTFELIRQTAELVRSSLQYLVALLEESNDDEPEEVLQSVFFEAGKLHFEKQLRWWFEVLYNILMKQKEGPRLGLSTKLLTIHWVIDNIKNVLSDPWMN